MKKLKVVFLGGRILGKRCLDILLKYKNEVDIICVIGHTNRGDTYSDWNPPIIPYAKKLGFSTLEPKNLSSKGVINLFNKTHPDILLNAFCDRLIPKEVLNTPRISAINFHYGKLPFYKGRFIVNHIIFNNEKKTCVTAHYITQKIDAGDIIFEKEIKIEPNETARSLYFKCTDATVVLFEKTIRSLIKNKPLPKKKQEPGGTYYPFAELNNSQVDLKWTKEKIERFIRAVSFPPVSLPWIEISGKKFQIIEKQENTLRPVA